MEEVEADCGQVANVGKGIVFAEESYRIKEACIAVHRELGCGFLEKVYENALANELRQMGCGVTQQCKLGAYYKGVCVGDYYADLVVDGRIIVEIKAAEKIAPIHRAQIINYLKATGFTLGLLVNFGKSFFEFERIIFTK